jgi:hypothetical protein
MGGGVSKSEEFGVGSADMGNLSLGWRKFTNPTQTEHYPNIGLVAREKLKFFEKTDFGNTEAMSFVAEMTANKVARIEINVSGYPEVARIEVSFA